ncbi:MAG: 1,4-alpha-glucan branching protein GlgB [Lachnospiraceae bacterium]|nr:1,4-alpha-glucan branching protein GlgB [Lachnospiraceae bacterium]
MTKKLYKLMNWADIEGIVYSEEDNPHRILGAHPSGLSTLVQFFYPGAVKATVITEKNAYKMEMADEEGFFAVLLPKTEKSGYTVEVEFEDGKTKEVCDPYNYKPLITKKDTEKFSNGIHYTIYELLGAHVKTIDGVTGVYFAVWAPNALRVSVVGDFNNWDGRVHQMRRLWDSGIFELFVPCANEKDNYKFEIKTKRGEVFLKADPYGNSSQLRPDTASVVTDLSKFKWTDEKWMKERKHFVPETSPISVLEIHLGSFAKPEEEDGRLFYNYRELAPKIIKYVKELGYTHIELMPVMEHPFDASWGYQVIGYYAPTSRYGSPEDFMFFMNEMHKNGIGVILDWVPAHFPKDDQGLSGFDGTCLYEHMDPRQGEHPQWGTKIFNYGRPEVKNYLIANVLYWINVYHADGIRMDAVASMLYLDYGKNDGQWVANMYGGKENLEAIEFLKHLNSIVHKAKDGVLMIAEESTAWPMVTDLVEKDGLGFDLKWNMGWMNDFTSYMQYDPFFRSHHHGELTFSMIYAYSEKFMLVLSHDEVVHGKSSMIGKMPGEIPDKFKNLRAAYGFMMTHPGKKLLFMGQDIAEFDEWNENRSIQWDLLQYDDHKNMKEFVKTLNKLYKESPALHKLDHSPEGFEWINNISANENVLVYLRKTEDENDTLLIVCNFANEERKDYKIGVPFPGKYKEILNSDARKFGGKGCVNGRALASDESECDGRENSIFIKMPALSMQIFSYTPFTQKELAAIEKRKEEERLRRLEIEQIEAAKEAENNARKLANDAMQQAKRAQEEAKEALKRAMEEAKRAEALEKEARALEKEANKRADESQKVKENAKFVK